MTDRSAEEQLDSCCRKEARKCINKQTEVTLEICLGNQRYQFPAPQGTKPALLPAAWSPPALFRLSPKWLSVDVLLERTASGDGVGAAYRDDFVALG